MNTFDRLTALDTSFLRAERPSLRLHLGAVSIFEGGPLTDAHARVRIDVVREAVRSRLHVVRRLRQRVAEVPLWLGRPVWVDDEHFDISHHVNAVHLPAPGTREQLLALAADLHEEPLDRSRPLWELWAVDGLEHGRVALVEKLHHAMVDGVSGVDVATAILDLDPDAGPSEESPTAATKAPGPWALMAAAAAEGARRVVSTPRSPAALARGVRRVVSDVARLQEEGLVAPASSLNGRVGSERVLRDLDLDLEAVRAAGRAYDAKVNDVVLAAIAGGVRALLLRRGDDVSRPLKVLVPVSLRGATDAMTLGNRVGALVAPLHVEIADAAARLVATAAWTHHAKHHGAAQATADLLGMADALPLPVVSAVSRFVVGRQPFVNLVVTNVPGVPVPLYLRGARLLETVPIVPLGGNMPVGVAVLSYNGRLALGFNADPESCPDLDVLVDATQESVEDLRVATAGRL